MNINRRDFMRVAVPSAAAVAALRSVELPMLGQAYGARPAAELVITDKTVVLSGDGLAISNQQRVQDLARLMTKYEKFADSYLVGGAVAELEQKMAAMLGKEDAAFLPTGTLANNVAVRLLCGEHRHAIVQQESHLYQDESDAASLLSGLNLVPLGAGKACPSYEEVVAAIDVAEKSPYPIVVGAISIESPVRRADGASVPYALAERISKLARSKGIGMHLDGARLLLLSGTAEFDVKRYSALFDTVYISLYKYLGAPFGAMLAGKKDVIAKVRETRHVYGGTVYHGWMAALPALDAVDGFQQRFAEAHRAGERLLAGLQAAGGFEILRVEHGSNIAFAQLTPARADGLVERLAKQDIHVRPLHEGRLTLMVNETILRRTPEELVAAFVGKA
ncbi:threonine aldolase family protein [Granulicella arctica]|uniref:threonine aldolase family protein n=1 Tax=Granulicella arctica TaxID=940613 RepID=UPI0021DF9F12|nr:threonine aldolase family protein [Granulicella arctica]